MEARLCCKIALPLRTQVKENAMTAFYGLASAYQAYVSTNGSMPTAGACRFYGARTNLFK